VTCGVGIGGRSAAGGLGSRESGRALATRLVCVGMMVVCA